MSEREIFRAEKLPVFQNKVFAKADDARSCSTGNVVLVENMKTGLIYNAAFDPSLLVYDADYQNEQAHSTVFRKHLENVTSIVDQFFLGKSLVEIGCGKGYFLNCLKQKGYRITGIDPAYEGGHPDIIASRFEPGLGITADGVILRHVLEHIVHPVDFLKGVLDANEGRGLIYIEVPCFDWICRNNAWFDVFYEHVNYFRISDFRRIFSHVLDAGYLFGGQYLYVVAELASLRDPILSFQDRVEFPEGFLDTVDHYSSLMRKAKNRKNVIWGGSSKGVIFTIYMQRAGAVVDMIVDINPAKQGKYAALSGVQILSPEQAMVNLVQGENIFVMNSNYFNEIVTITKDQYRYFKVERDGIESRN